MKLLPKSRTLIAGLATLGALCGGAAWLTGSESGLQTLSELASGASGGQLHIAQASGRLLGPLTLGQVRWTSPDLQVDIDGLQLDWSPAELLHGHLRIGELRIERLHITSAASSTPPVLPTDLSLPLSVDLEKTAISRLEYGNLLLVRDLAGHLHSDGRKHALDDLRATLGDATLSGHARLAGTAPFALEASAAIAGQLDKRALALSLQASGPLEKIALAAVAESGISGRADAVLTPFAKTVFASAQIAIDDFDPAAWQAGAPSARFALRADLKPDAAGIGGRFSLANRIPGPLDRQRLPLERLDGRLVWQDEIARLDALHATLPGKGELNGSGRWQAGTLHLELQASRLDAAQLVAALRATQLNGPISANLDANRQSLQLDLKDTRFALRATASQAAGEIDLASLELSSGPARLKARGKLALGKEMAFGGDGELEQFDPSRFAQVTPARINARFAASGKLQPQAQVDGHFELRDSQWAGQPLTGQGQLKIDWPQVPLAEIHLQAGVNRLDTHGAFGRPGDRLQVELDAPQLGPYGIDGGASGHFELAGTPQQLQLAARLQAARLGLPGRVRVSGLKLDATAGGAANAPLKLDLAASTLETPERPALLRQLRIQLNGNRLAHRLNASADLAGKNHLLLELAGGLPETKDALTWRGQLEQASVLAADPARNVRLVAPAPLQLAAERWHLGPARLAGEPLDWQATLDVGADQKQLAASLQARGSRVGRIDAQLNAGMQGAWTLNRQAAWQGKLNSEIADLAWLGELIGEQWRTAGRFNGELKLAGTPDKPVASGRFRGSELALRLPEQGLNLNRGELAVDLDNNLLRVGKLGFDSVLQAAPRPLLISGRGDLAALTAKPGRLEITGEMQVDRPAGAEHAFLDVHLDRLGAWQLPDQWVSVSGSGRLSWQDGTLGAKGKLAVDAGYWQLARSGAPRLSDDVVVRRAGQEKANTSLRPKLDLDVSTELGDNFLFSGAGLNTRLTGDIRLRASGRDLPRASGTIRTRAGRFEAYGQQLAIERGILTFQGLPDNPALDVRAVRQGLSVEPGVHITGTAQRPVIKLISDPELPDSEKLAWLVLGHGPEQMGAGDATVLLSAAGGLLGNDAGNVVQQLKKNFGFDELGVRTGQIGDNGSRQQISRVAAGTFDSTASTGAQIFSVGKRLSSNAMLSYEQALGKAESVVKLTISLSRQISVIGRAGSDNAVDLFYTLTFGRPDKAGVP